MKRLIVGLVLFVISIILVVVLSATTFMSTIFYYLITLKFRNGLNEIGNWFYKMALSLDQFGNVTCNKVFQVALTKHNAYEFGRTDQTVSYVLGKNKAIGKLSYIGRLLCGILDWLEDNHVEKAVELYEDAASRKQLNYIEIPK